ncbi:uncharacterized protein [Hemitrygon akajei]|uniref:uncharacterized protein n=1 Tax=Hemitrygon akajei TaxID=2704970 RepID=UPI003BF9B904
MPCVLAALNKGHCFAETQIPEDALGNLSACFGGVACRLASDHDPEAKEPPASVNESDKAAIQNIERDEDIADKAKTAPAGDRHGAGNACEAEATEMTCKDPVTGVRDDRPGTSDGGERIDGFGGITDRLESDHDPEQTASLNESEKNALQNIELVEGIVDKEKTRRTEDKNSASNESELDATEMSDKVRRTGLRDEKPKTSKDEGRIVHTEIKENLDTSNESNGSTPDRIATEVEAADDEKRGPADDEHHADNGGFGGVACRLASDHDPEAKEPPASVNESDKAAIQNIERDEDIADKAKTAPAGDRHGAGNACEAEAMEMTCKDPVTGVRDDRPGTSVGGERIDGFGGITDRIESDHDPEQTASSNESEKSALQNIELVEGIVDKQKTRRTEDKNSASNECELDATEMTDKVRRTGLRDEKPKTSKEGGWRVGE